MKWGLWVTWAMAIILCIFSGTIADYFFHKPEFRSPLMWIALSIPFFACYNLYGMALQGLRKVIYSVSILKIIAPLILIILVLIFSPHNGTSASMLYLFSSIGAACWVITGGKKIYLM